MAYYETNIRQKIIILQKSPGHVNIVTFWHHSPVSRINPIQAQGESLWRGQMSSCFTCEMADFEWQIGHELWYYRNYPCHVSGLIVGDDQTNTVSWFDPITGRFSKKFLSCLTQNRPKVNGVPCSYVNIALIQSNLSNLIKISRSCSKVIQRTLRSGKNWLRYSSFSAMSRVEWPNLQAWPKFRALQDFPTHTGKTRQGVQKKLKLRRQKRHDFSRMRLAQVFWSYL